MPKNKVADILAKIDILPTLPASYHNIVTKLDNPKSDIHSIAEAIKKDMVVTARILKIINSAFYSLPRTITSVEQGVSLLGRSAVKNLATMNSILKILNLSNEISGLWTHSLAVALCSKKIGEELNYPEIEELFLSGLMHDIGKVVQVYLFREDIDEIFEKAKVNGKSYHHLEVEYFELDHPSIAKYLLERWKIPANITNSIEYHHKPLENMEHASESAILHISDSIARSSNLGETFDGNLPIQVDDQCLKKAGISRSFMDTLGEKIGLELEDSYRIFFSD